MRSLQMKDKAKKGPAQAGFRPSIPGVSRDAVTSAPALNRISLSQRLTPCVVTGVPDTIWAHYNMVITQTSASVQHVQFILKPEYQALSIKMALPLVVSRENVAQLGRSRSYFRMISGDEKTSEEKEVINALMAANLPPSAVNKSRIREIITMVESAEANYRILSECPGWNPDHEVLFKSFLALLSKFVFEPPEIGMAEYFELHNVPLFIRNQFTSKELAPSYSRSVERNMLSAGPKPFITVGETMRPNCYVYFNAFGFDTFSIIESWKDRIKSCVPDAGAVYESWKRKHLPLPNNVLDLRVSVEALSNKDAAPFISTGYSALDDIAKESRGTFAIFDTIYPDEVLVKWKKIHPDIQHPGLGAGPINKQAAILLGKPPSGSVLRRIERGTEVVETDPEKILRGKQSAFLKWKREQCEYCTQSIKDVDVLIQEESAKSDLADVDQLAEHRANRASFVADLAASTAEISAGKKSPANEKAVEAMPPPTKIIFDTLANTWQSITDAPDLKKGITDQDKKSWETKFGDVKEVEKPDSTNAMVTGGSYPLGKKALDCVGLLRSHLTVKGQISLVGFLQQFDGMLQDMSANMVVASQTAGAFDEEDNLLEDVTWLNKLTTGELA